MKFQTLGLLILVLLLAANVYMFVKLKEIDRHAEARNTTESTQRASESEENKDNGEHDEVELIQVMKDNLYFMDKLYFAGKAGNWDLAKFYHHEIEETMEQVTEAQFHYDGFDITNLSNQMFVPPFEEVERAIEAKDKAVFDEKYRMLVRSCNNCHIATDHAFITVTVPEIPTVRNQQFK